MGKLKSFRVTKRFEMWVEREIEAVDMVTALATAKEMRHGDFFTAKRDTEVLDETTLDGTGISEQW